MVGEILTRKLKKGTCTSGDNRGIRGERKNADGVYPEKVILGVYNGFRRKLKFSHRSRIYE